MTSRALEPRRGTRTASKARLTTAQAIVRYLQRQYSERDGQTFRLVQAIRPDHRARKAAAGFTMLSGSRPVSTATTLAAAWRWRFWIDSSE